MGKLVSLLWVLPVAGCAVIDGLTGDSGPFPLDFTIDIETSHHAVAADFNGDGLADLAVTQPSSDRIKLFLSSNGHRFGTDYDGASDQGSCDADSRLFAVQLDDDSAAELVVVDPEVDGSISHLTLWSEPAGVSAIKSVDVEGTVHSITSGAFADGAGMVVATQGPDRLVMVYPNFTGDPSVTTIRELGLTDGGVMSVVAATFDLDPYLDLAYGHGGGASVMYGRADGSFTDPRLIDLGPITQVAAADMAPGDADELVVLGTSMGWNVWSVMVVEANSDQVLGGFSMDGMTQPAVQIGLGNLDTWSPFDVVILPGGELAPEAALGFTGGTGGGGFASYLDLGLDLHPPPERLWVVDFDGDGHDDLIAVGNGTVRGYRNNVGGGS